jgi:MFS family permease
LLIGFAPDLAWLGAGRFVTGLAVGMGTVSYVYVAEVSEAAQRGTLAACGPVLVSLGVLAVYILGAAMHWRFVALFSAAVALVTGLIALMLPETPPWLAARGKLRKANDALIWLRHSNEVAQIELSKLQIEKENDTENTPR